jgi:hypothetical protein
MITDLDEKSYRCECEEMEGKQKLDDEKDFVSLNICMVLGGLV